MIEPLRLSLVVRCSCDAAFRIWTEYTTMWWPADHTATGQTDSVVTFEPFVGGRIYERTAAGAEVDWGRVVTWEPPARLGYLCHLRADQADATDVEITFSRHEEDQCRVDVEHRGWERLGDAGPGRRDANRRGWSGLLPHYVEECDRLAPAELPAGNERSRRHDAGGFGR